MLQPFIVSLPVLRCDFCGSIHLEENKAQGKCLVPTPECSVKPEDVVLAHLEVVNSGTPVGSTYIRCRVLKVSSPAEYYKGKPIVPENLEGGRTVEEHGIGFRPPFHNHDWLVQVKPLEQPEDTFGPDDKYGHCEEQWTPQKNLRPVS